MNELDALDPVPEQVKLASGTVVQFEDLRARQFFKLLRIITRGGLPVARDMGLFTLDSETDTSEYVAKLMAVLMMSIPEAEQQTIEFLRSMCKPVGLIERRGLNRQDTARNDELWANLFDELDNPHLGDLITLVEAIIRRESADIQALGKRLAGMFQMAQKTGQIPAPTHQTSPDRTSSADSPEPSTSSPANTAGPTTSSPTSPSDGSANASPPSPNDASRPTTKGTKR